VGSFVLLFFSVIATRAVFSLPLALPANWVFRLTAVEEPIAYRAATRKALLVLCALPVWLCWAALYLAIWPVQPSLQHLAILALAAVIMTDLALYRFRKIPFACSYLPGKANLHVRLAIGAIAFTFITTQGVELEFWTLHNSSAFLILVAVLGLIGRWAYQRWANYPVSQLQFEEPPPEDIESLNLHGDGGNGAARIELPPMETGPAPSSFGQIFQSGESGAGSFRATSFLTAAAPVEVPRTPFSFEQLFRDFVGGTRILTRAPGFSAAAIRLGDWFGNLRSGQRGTGAAALWDYANRRRHLRRGGCAADGCIASGILFAGAKGVAD